MKREKIKEDRFEYRKVYSEKVVKSAKSYNKKKNVKRSRFYEDFQDENDY